MPQHDAARCSARIIPAEICARFETDAKLSDEDRKAVVKIARRALEHFQTKPKPDSKPSQNRSRNQTPNRSQNRSRNQTLSRSRNRSRNQTLSRSRNRSRNQTLSRSRNRSQNRAKTRVETRDSTQGTLMSSRLGVSLRRKISIAGRSSRRWCAR